MIRLAFRYSVRYTFYDLLLFFRCSGAEAKCVTVNPRRPEQLAVGANDAYARVFDRRMIKLMQVKRTEKIFIFSSL